MNNKNFSQIKEQKKLCDIRNSLNEIIDQQINFNIDWIKKNNFAVVPIESSCHFNDEDANLIAKAIEYLSINECYVCNPDKLGLYNECYQFEISKENILILSSKFAHRNCVILPENFSFVILCTVEDYYLLCGTNNFVSIAVGGNILNAKKQFLDFALDKFWNKYDRDFFYNIYKKYEPFYG